MTWRTQVPAAAAPLPQAPMAPRLPVHRLKHLLQTPTRKARRRKRRRNICWCSEKLETVNSGCCVQRGGRFVCEPKNSGKSEVLHGKKFEREVPPNGRGAESEAG